MVTQAPQVSVVIPTKNGGPLFLELLEQLLRQKTSFTCEYVFIDSGSSDGTVEAARKSGATVHEIPATEFNHGATRNLAIEKSSGEIVVLLTQDAIPADENLIEELAKLFFAEADIAGVCGRQSPRPEADVLTKRNLNTWLTGQLEPNIRRIENRSSYDAWTPIERYMFCNFDNVCSAIRRSVWRTLPFNPISFGEDIDWSKRVLEAGWKIAYAPGAHVIHSHDRPISYEYKRTYMCHQTLYRLFGVCTVPSPKYAFRSIFNVTLTDIRYVLQQNMNLSKKMAMIFRIPLLAVASVWGQLKGAGDEREKRARTMAGI